MSHSTAIKKSKERQRQGNKAGVPGNKTISMLERLVSAVQLDRLARADWLGAALLCAGFLALFMLTLCPTIYIGDSAEFAAVAACWGVAHPPGYPLYSLLSGLFVRLLPIGEIAWRANLFSAVCGSMAIGVLFLLCRRTRASRPAAAAAAMCFGLGATFWSQALVAEVYCLDILLILLALFFAFRLFEQPVRGNYCLCGLISGLMLGHRILNLVYFVPVVFVFMAVARKRSGQPLSVFLYALMGILLSGVVFLYLPVATFFHPPFDSGSPDTPGRFWNLITANVFQQYFGMSPFSKELERAGGFFTMLPANLGVAVLAAPVGCWLLFRRGEWLLGGGLIYAVACCIGFSAQYPIPDISVYFLPALAMLALAAACGFDLLPRRFVWLAVLLGLVNVPLQYQSQDLSSVRLAEQYGTDVLSLAKPDAIILTQDDSDAFILDYLQSIKGLRPDVSLAPAGSDIPPADWYAAQLKQKYPQVKWPSQGFLYYLQDQQIQRGESWLKTLLRDNIEKHPVCMTDHPEHVLRDRKLNDFLPYWHNVPDGILYCLDRPGEPLDTEQRIAEAQAFWDRHAEGGGKIPDRPEVNIAMMELKYVLAQFFYATALAQSGHIPEALKHMRIIAASDADRIEDTVNEVYYTPGYRLVERANKALVALSKEEETAAQNQGAPGKK